MIVDSHCHVGQVWYEPAETLLFQMDRCGVDQAVLIQMLGQFDNRYQQDCIRRWPDRFVSVVAVEPAAPDAVAALQRLVDGGAAGVRLRPTARSPGDDPFAIWQAAATLRVSVSCVGTTRQFTDPAFADVIGRFPDLSIVLEHLGGIARPDADETAEQVWDLAQFDNVFLKVPGIGQLSKRAALLPAQGSPFASGGDAPIRKAMMAFSAERLMWGSDFPVVSTREGYASAMQGPYACLGDADDAELAAMFGGVASRVFRTGI